MEHNEQYADDQDENKPPQGLIQEQKQRQISGILQPATDIPVVLLEDQQSQNNIEDKIEASVCGDNEIKGEYEFVSRYLQRVNVKHILLVVLQLVSNTSLFTYVRFTS